MEKLQDLLSWASGWGTSRVWSASLGTGPGSGGTLWRMFSSDHNIPWACHMSSTALIPRIGARRQESCPQSLPPGVSV